jgi:exopolysaccharide biosynthesis polyprenyl glycosylphosphotransferase
MFAFFGCIFGVYDRHNFTSIGRMAGQALGVTGLALVSTSVTFEWLGYVHIGRWVIIGSFVIASTAAFLCRMAARELACRAKARLMLVGPRRKFRPLALQLRTAHREFYERPVYLSKLSESVAERRNQIMDAFHAHRPDEIVVMDNDSTLVDLLHHSALILRSGCGVFSYSTYHEKLLGEVPVHCIDERGVLGGGFNVGSLHTGLVKRPLDMLLAIIGLLIGAPLMLLCAIVVKLTSPGPIIYKQVRVGRYGRLFHIYKFRTMRADAERDGAQWAKTKDVRVTPVGNLLRRTRFDELPQLWNILRGDMSLVGPRPERPEFVETLRNQIPHYELRHLVPPGLTGWAQVRFRYGSTIEDAQRKLAFDLFYVRHCGLTFDAAICLRTLAAMAKGAR